MHEHSLMRGLMAKLADVARENGGRRLVGVRLRLGALAHISAAHLREHFIQAARGGVAEGAALEIDEATDHTDPTAQDIVLVSVEVEQ